LYTENRERLLTSVIQLKPISRRCGV